MWARNFFLVIKIRHFLIFWIRIAGWLLAGVYWLSDVKNGYPLSLKYKNNFLQFLYPEDTDFIHPLELPEINIEFDESQFEGAISALF